MVCKWSGRTTIAEILKGWFFLTCLNAERNTSIFSTSIDVLRSAKLTVKRKTCSGYVGSTIAHGLSMVIGLFYWGSLLFPTYRAVAKAMRLDVLRDIREGIDAALAVGDSPTMPKYTYTYTNKLTARCKRFLPGSIPVLIIRPVVVWLILKRCCRIRSIFCLQI